MTEGLQRLDFNFALFIGLLFQSTDSLCLSGSLNNFLSKEFCYMCNNSCPFQQSSIFFDIKRYQKPKVHESLTTHEKSTSLLQCRKRQVLSRLPGENEKRKS